MSALPKKSRPLRGLLFLTLACLYHFHTPFAVRLRSSLARLDCSGPLGSATPFSSLACGQDGPEPDEVVAVGRVVVDAVRRPAEERDVVPTAAAKHTERA
jgi:hypothetical protein